MEVRLRRAMGEVLVKAMANSKAGSMAATDIPLGQPNAINSKGATHLFRRKSDLLA
jgi:hypothetical protein